MRFRMRRAVVAVAAVAFASAAVAAPQAKTEARPDAKSSAAAGDVQTFGDWTLRCGTGPTGEHACEVSSMIKRPGSTGPIAQIAFGRQVAAGQAEKDKPEKDKAEKDKAGKDKPAAAEADKLAAAAALQAGTPARIKLVVLIPVNVTIAPGVELGADAAEPVRMPIKTCIQAACFAEALLTDAQVKTFRSKSQPGRLVFTDPGERPVAVEVPFKGLDQALDALERK